MTGGDPRREAWSAIRESVRELVADGVDFVPAVARANRAPARAAA